MIEILIVSLSILLIVLVELINYNPKPLFGIYQQKNGFYWIKVGLVYALLSLRKLKKRDIKADISTEGAQRLSLHDKAIDATYLNGSSKNGDFFVMNVARRNPPLVDGFFYLKIQNSNFGLLESPKLPQTNLQSSSEQFEAEGLSFKMLEPMKKWEFSYQGKMKKFSNRNQFHEVKVNAVWTAVSEYVNFDRDIDPFSFAKSLALEKWSRSYFDTLQSNHQTHIEQYGILKGTATIDEEAYNFELNTVRDHTVGTKREWKQFKRYVLHYFTDSKGNFFNMGIICNPISFSNLNIGYYYSSKMNKVFPVKGTDFKLYQYGSKFGPTKNYAFTITAAGESFVVTVKMQEQPYFYVSKDCEVKIYECPCIYSVNGAEAWGASEWLYRTVESKKI